MKIKNTDLLQRMLELEQSYTEDIFARGYYYAKIEPRYKPRSWEGFSVFGGRLYKDSRLQITRSSSNTTQIACLGEITDIRVPAEGSQQVLDRLVKYLEYSESNFFRSLSWTNGRYVLLYRKNSENIKVLNDATGMRPVFYEGNKANAISSHAALMAVNATQADPQNIKKISVTHDGGFPGRLTPYENIYFLTPNTYMEMPGGKIVRYYPQEKIQTKTVEEIVTKCTNLLVRSSQSLLNRSTAIMSLTAGVDSRTILSVIKQHAPNIRFFVYYTPDDASDGNMTDVVIANSIAKRFGLNLELMDLSNYVLEDGFLELCSVNSHYRHRPLAAQYYFNNLSKKDGFHMRANVAEIGSAFYANRLGPESKLSPSSLVACYAESRHLKQPLQEERGLKDFYLECKHDFIEASQFERGAQFMDFRDLFYWEHRMGCWHSQVASESDPAFETMSVFNCRKVLECFLTPSLEDRRMRKLFYAVIERNWHELSEFPYNPKTVSSTDFGRAKQQLESQ